MSMQSKFAQVSGHLNSTLVARNIEINYSLAAMLSGQNIFLYGVPGTAKSMLYTEMAKCFDGMRYFQNLMHASTTPQDLFGPMSLQELKNDRLRYKTEGFLPTAHIAFLDEIFKCNAAILNALLTIINEHKFFNGGEIQDAPLVSCFGASNEIPEDPSLGALYDRFVGRIKVDPTNNVNDFSRVMALSLGLVEKKDPPKLTLGELAQAQKEVLNISVDQTFFGTMYEVKQKMLDTFGNDLYVSDRRLAMIIRLMRAMAYLDGKQEVRASMLPRMYNCFWQEPGQIERIRAILHEYRSPVMDEVKQKIASIYSDLIRMNNSLRNFIQHINDNKSQWGTDTSIRTMRANFKKSYEPSMTALGNRVKSLNETEFPAWESSDDDLATDPDFQDYKTWSKELHLSLVAQFTVLAVADFKIKPPLPLFVKQPAI